MKDAVKEMMSLSQGMYVLLSCTVYYYYYTPAVWLAASLKSGGTGVERADVSAEAEAGEVRVEVTGGIDMDPAKLCCLLQEATKKKRVRIAEEASVPSPGRQTTLSGQGSGTPAAIHFVLKTDCAVLLLLGTSPHTHVPVLFFSLSLFLYILLSVLYYVGHESFGVIFSQGAELVRLGNLPTRIFCLLT